MPLTDKELERIAAALAAPRRIRILKEISVSHVPYPCTAVVHSQNIGAAIVSHHLKELERAELITV
jgi:ArsR family transcriptional regulator